MKPHKLPLILALWAMPLAADEYLGQLSANCLDAESTCNPYGQGLSIYGDDDG